MQTSIIEKLIQNTPNIANNIHTRSNHAFKTQDSHTRKDITLINSKIIQTQTVTQTI